MTALAFTKAELRTIGVRLASLPSPGPRPLTAEETLEVNALVDKTRAMIAASAAAYERGRLVFSWRVPREQALTLNQYAHMKGWQKKKMRAALDDELRKLLPAFPEALTNGSLVKRWLRVTRFSTQRLDDLSIDSCGGKMPVDALVRCGILADDDEKHAHREPRWEKTPRGNTHCLVEVFLIANEQVPAQEPSTATVQQIVRVPGIMTAMLKAGLPK